MNIEGNTTKNNGKNKKNNNEGKDPGAVPATGGALGEDETRRSILARMGDQIADLLDFVTPRHNVHGDIKRKVNALSIAYSRLMKLEEKASRAFPVAPKRPAATQTSPKADVATMAIMSPSLSGQVAKRKPGPLEAASAKKTKGNNPAPNAASSNQGQPSQTKLVEGPANKWIRVTRKPRQTRKHKKRPPLPSALLIQKTGTLSYAEILSKIKGDDKLSSVGESISKIRRTKAGEMILILGKNNEEKTTEICEAFKSVLGEEALIKSKVKHTLLEIRDLDEIATKEEVKVAIQKAMDNDIEVGLDSVKSIRKAYGGTQTAVVSLPTAVSEKLTRVGKLRVGWVSCRVRELIRPLKCFRCWQYGHLSKDCQSEADRSDCCMKCGEVGHKANGCNSEPRCLLCSGKGTEVDPKHSSGSNRCAAYRRAYQDVLRKQR